MQSNLYDEDTGQALPSIEVAQQVKEAEEAAQASHDIRAMTETAGWKRVEEWLADHIEKAKEALIDADDPKTIVSLQQRARAYSDIIGFIQHEASQDRFLKEQQAQSEVPAA
jgi:hypothetical protein